MICILVHSFLETQNLMLYNNTGTVPITDTLDPLLHRKSFEFEDVVRLSAQQASRVKEGRRSGLFHALSEDSIYEDISCE